MIYIRHNNYKNYTTIKTYKYLTQQNLVKVMVRDDKNIILQSHITVLHN